MSNIKNRVIQFIEIEGIAKEDFYKSIDMTSASFRGKAKNTPLNSNAIANILLKLPQMDAKWLITGEGEMLVNNTAEKNLDRLYDLLEKVIAGQTTMIEQYSETLKINNQLTDQLAKSTQIIEKLSEKLK